MPQDRTYLQRRGEVWYARVIVPPSLRVHLGTHLRKSLKTKSLPEANQRKHAVVAELKKQIAQTKQGNTWKDWRESLRKANSEAEVELLGSLIEDEADRLWEAKGENEAKGFYRKATQTKDTLSELAETYLGLNAHSKDSHKKHEMALRELRDFFRDDDLPPSAIDPQMILSFIDSLSEGPLGVCAAEAQ